MKKAMIATGLILLTVFAFSGQCLAEPSSLGIYFEDQRAETTGKCFYVTEAHLYSGRGVWLDGSPAGQAYNNQSSNIIANSSGSTDCPGTPKGYIRFKPCEDCTPPSVADCVNCDKTVTLYFDCASSVYRFDGGMKEERCGATFELDADLSSVWIAQMWIYITD